MKKEKKKYIKEIRNIFHNGVDTIKLKKKNLPLPLTYSFSFYILHKTKTYTITEKRANA